MNPVEKASQACGGQTALAKLMGVSPQAVNKWKSGSTPAERCPDIERVTGGAVKCEELRPDVDWSVLRNS